MGKLALSLPIVFLFLYGLGNTQSHSAFPVDILAGPSPQMVMADGHEHLLYELHLTNFSTSPIELLGLDVLGDNAATPLASYRAEALDKLLYAIGPVDSMANRRSLAGGRSAVLFMDLTLDQGAYVPAELRHRFLFSIPKKKDGSVGTIENAVNGAVVTVIQNSPPVLHPPLRGASWVAFNSLGSDTHRRAFVAMDGKMRLAQRLAIDWMRLGPDGRLFRGDPKSNANFYGYGAEVLAVADARVSDVKDGFPDNAGSNEASSRNITLENLVGNYVVLDLGQGRFAVYAHLQPGSLKVKPGDTVKAGQALALLGNSGNSDAPHLHFHLMDGDSPAGSEGIPYVLDSFTQLGVLSGPEVLDTGEAWQPKSEEKPVVRHREFPVDNAVVSFP